VLFTADHGDMLYSHGEVRKQRPWDESNHTPMLLRWPKGLGKGRKVEAPINTEDLMPTLLGLSGNEIPKTVEGHDFTNYLEHGGADPSGGATVIACPSPFGEYQRIKGGREYRGVCTTRYTYVRGLDGPWLLFDNQEDPYQMHNLVGMPEHAALQKQLDDLLNQKLKEEHDDFRPGPEYIAKWGWKVDKNGTAPYKN
jgi:arylsulfatase A-like enzyme